MRLKLYCNRYGHFKDALVCSVNCVYRTRCHDFALFYDENRQNLDSLVANYFAARREPEEGRQTPPTSTARLLPLAPVSPLVAPVDLRALIRLEVKREMAEAFYIWIDREDRAELVETNEILRRAERGQKPKHIYKVSQEMELRFQLVPRKRIEKAKRTAEVEAERANARRTRTSRSVAARNAPANELVPFPAPVDSYDEDELVTETPAPRRSRTRSVKVAGGR